MLNPSVHADLHASPFLLTPASAHTLRTYLKTYCPTKTVVFCSQHTRHASTAAFKTYLLQYAAVRALLRPVYNLLARATRIAHGITHSNNVDDLERVFRGDARTAYLWSTCLEEDEAGWFWSAVGSRTMKPTVHCPGCVVDRTLHTETTIRLMLAACCLAQIRAEVTAEEAAYDDDVAVEEEDEDDDDDDDDHPARQDAALAEVARHWAHAVQESLSHDAFWRPAGIRADALPRANILAETFWCLEGACEEMESLVGSAAGGAGVGVWECVESPLEEYTREQLEARQQMAQRRSVVEAFVGEWNRQLGMSEVDDDEETEVVGADVAVLGTTKISA